MKTKICKKCHKEKDFSSFYKRKISKDGYRHVCKDCQKENNKYHIDHIVPLSIAKNEEEVIRLCNYTNLQLLTAQDNLKKSNKIGEF